MKKIYQAGVACLLLLLGCSTPEKLVSIIPETPSTAPDYFCTWTIQGYVTNFSSVETQRNAINEQNIFGKGVNQNWSGMFQKIKGDLYFLLDDSWDVPFNNDKSYFGSLIVDQDRFPSVKGLKPAERLQTLSGMIRKAGWKGLGLWTCAQEAPRYHADDSLAYFKERFGWMDKADIGYWKVDWGEKDKSPQWRAFLTKTGKENAPGLNIEHALTPDVLASAELYRTYDVEGVVSIPHTIARIGKMLSYLSEGKAVSVLNCEDEAYIAAGAGCSIGVMRHEFKGELPNGVQDMVFPPAGRDLKNRLDEVVRAIRWHRIAVPFAINRTEIFIDTLQLHDYWVMAANETWMSRKVGEVNSMSAPAIITRGIEKPVVTLKPGDTLRPYILASKYPNGAIAVAAIGRTINRAYLTPKANVTIKAPNLDSPLGVFGYFNELAIQLAEPSSFKQILAQDLAGDTPVDVTNKIIQKGNMIIISGDLIDEIGLMNATKGDKSEPGLVFTFRK
jgi:hypothetical protein